MGRDAGQTYRLLLITTDKGCARTIPELLSSSKTPPSDPAGFHLVTETTVENGFSHLVKGDVDLVLLDVDRPDARGLDIVTSFLDERFDVPLVVLTGAEDGDFGVHAVERGAQDYLIKGALNPEILRRAVRYALERHRLIRELKRRALIDDLTGLYNRRGFFYLGEHALSLAERNKTKQFIMFADLDGLKIVNDTRGHEAGDRYILQAAEFLRRVFRESDIIARIGGDEFAIIAQAVTRESIVSVRRRFEEGLERWNRESGSRDPLSLSVGIVFAEEPSPNKLDSLLASADHLMYRDKARKKG